MAINETAWVLKNRTLRASVVAKKRVLIRVDFNVPLSNGVIASDDRIRASLDTIQYCLLHGAQQIILVSHLGRPSGFTKKESMAGVRARVEQLLGLPVALAPSCLYADFLKLSTAVQRARIILLENVRFHPEEEKNDAVFAKQLAQFADIIINDAFGTAHRAHASNSGVASFAPVYIGKLMEREIRYLGSVIMKPKRPLVVILGFAKISDKIGVLTNLAKKADVILLGGAVAFTFLAAQGFSTGKSLVEVDQIPLAKKILKQYGKKIILPVDVVCATDLAQPRPLVFSIATIPEHLAGYDIGPASAARFLSYVAKAKTVFWNGPEGVFEHPPYDRGTTHIAREIAALTKQGRLISIIGGGDTALAIAHAGTSGDMTFVSTGGGASLEFMENRPLRAISAIYAGRNIGNPRKRSLKRK